MDDRALTEKSRDFRHSGEGTEENRKEEDTTTREVKERCWFEVDEDCTCRKKMIVSASALLTSRNDNDNAPMMIAWKMKLPSVIACVTQSPLMIWILLFMTSFTCAKMLITNGLALLLCFPCSNCAL